MNGALYALLACFLASVGARDQMLLAAMTLQQGRRVALVITACATGLMACTVAGIFAREVMNDLDHPHRLVAAAVGLGLAGLESLFRRPRKLPKEPTHSLFAAAVVLLADQLTDPARFLVLTLGISALEPLPATLGGAFGGGAALVVGAIHARALLGRQHLLRAARRLAGLVLLAVAIGLVLWLKLVVLPA